MSRKQKTYIAVILILTLAGAAAYRTIRNLDTQSEPSVTIDQESTVKLAPKLSAQRLLKKVNEKRKEAGAPPLKLDARFNSSAQRKAKELKADKTPNENLHVNDLGVHGYSYAREAGPECLLVSENILPFTAELARDKTLNLNDVAVDSWMRSQSHREAMLDSRYDLTGFGFTGVYVVQHFCDL